MFPRKVASGSLPKSYAYCFGQSAKVKLLTKVLNFGCCHIFHFSLQQFYIGLRNSNDFAYDYEKEHTRFTPNIQHTHRESR